MGSNLSLVMQHECQSTSLSSWLFMVVSDFVSWGGQIQREAALVQDKLEIMGICCVKCSPVVKQIFEGWFTNTQRKYEEPDLSLTFIHLHLGMTPPRRSRLEDLRRLRRCLMVHPSHELMMNMSKKKSAKIRKELKEGSTVFMQWLDFLDCAH